MYIDKYQISEEEIKKVLNIYFKEERLIQIPKKEKKRVVILLYISRKFQKNTYYTEKEVNEILKDVFEDFVMIRRYLIDYKLLNRNKEGTKYWVVNT
ncbi:DUF2087 domain-containing protein [Priestia aryabhattai]|jgi:hypothetical protein|uniref:DUF2087 domain-containing protein n=1 Tax=Priestia TaxID=2800373 RepID=UPI0007ABD858|nr:MULTISPECIES: DUF2087 domain-containing protein [Priestia]KZE15747.1 hypothetical protein AVW12_01750 [Priestia aryabhattai]NLR42896.1 DUF2087 domain-containing protein [Priestia megaterium]WDC90153.1 DUF2087 domain-containing protein [Priestia megaterium]